MEETIDQTQRGLKANMEEFEFLGATPEITDRTELNHLQELMHVDIVERKEG